MINLNRIKKMIFFGVVIIPQSTLAFLVSIPWIVSGLISDTFGRYYEIGQAISCVPFPFGEWLRYFFYKGTLKKVGFKVTFKYGSYCQYRNTIIGSRVLIGAYCCLGEVNIGNDVLIGGFVNFLSGMGQHGFDDRSRLIREQPGAGRRMIQIGSDVWIGSNSVICDNVGDRSVIGVGSLVVKSVEGHGIYVGRPARKVRQI